MTMPQYTEEPIERTGHHAQDEFGRAERGMSQQPKPAHDFEATLTRDMRVALHDFVQVATICNWCADECLGMPEMEECARLCRDVADLAALNVQFLSRDSIFGVDVAETFAYAAEQCEQVCSQFSEPHCQECASVLRRAIDSTWAMLDSFEHIPQQGQQYQQPTLEQY
ncbi:MAG: four-helix bundle copper-binding protein [Halolamina sp.]